MGVYTFLHGIESVSLYIRGRVKTYTLNRGRELSTNMTITNDLIQEVNIQEVNI